MYIPIRFNLLVQSLSELTHENNFCVFDGAHLEM